MFAVMTYINAQDEPKNPFVKGFGTAMNGPQAYEYLVEALEECEIYFPEMEQMIEEILISENE